MQRSRSVSGPDRRLRSLRGIATFAAVEVLAADWLGAP
jgi:hypothetical protein